MSREQAPPSPPPKAAKWARTLTRDGEFAGVAVHGQVTSWHDFYHTVMKARWTVVALSFFAAYLAANLGFALLYLLGGDDIANAEPGSFTDAFFFSVQTMATIGYGAMAPKTIYAHVLVTLEAIFGLFSLALATGIVFAKFARPMARVVWSDIAILTKRNGIPHLVFRVANARANQIVEASMRVCALKFETTSEGERMRRFFDLSLIRSNNPIFAMTWTVMHPIDEQSPLHGMTVDELGQGNVEILAILTGLDSTFGATIHARYAYAADDIVEDAHFEDVIVMLPDGRRGVDITRISLWSPNEAKDEAAGSEASKAA
ncbi:ion channel [Polyangium sp. 6x1]|uniref:ion channel n=1 Tax=Polyangium sp. 6x1 TaxID=3042689 RepID=UPI002482D617|nr:ion channel [Polyangium sp. 6x1]MDI1448637.1 ion channel [Polyangium sp. 6x1]